MRKLLKHVLSLVLILALTALAGCEGGYLTTRRAAYLATPSPSPAAAPAASPQPAPEPSLRPEPTAPFEPFVYRAPDIEGLREALDSLLADIEAGGEAGALIERYADVVGMYDAADAACQIAYLLYAEDVTADTYWGEYARIEEALLELDLTMTDVSVALFDSSDEANRLARERFGDGYVDAVYAGETLNSEQVIDLFVADNELQGEYDRLLAGFTFRYKGREWTYDDMFEDNTLDLDGYIDLYERYTEELNREAGALFCEMLALRSQIAAKLGYGSYAAYRYDCYGRDYTITEAQAFHAMVKEHIVPVFIEAGERTADSDLYEAEYELDSFFDSFEAALEGNRLSLEALHYLRIGRLYDFDVSDKKMESSFTTYISTLQRPFIFTQWEDDAYSVGTVLHEFGHFMNYYFNPAAGWCSGDSLDLAEVDSQAFVLLMFPAYEKLFGREYAEPARAEQLFDALYAIVTGSMEDEFQQRVYADPGMTLAEMNALYGQLATAYGMNEVYSSFSGTEWVLIPHSYQSPMYYISYAVSMLAALEIWGELENSDGDAWMAYFGVLMREPYADFRQILAENDLGDPFSETTVRRMAELVDRSMAS